MREIPSKNMSQWIIQVEDLKRTPSEAQIGLRFFNPDSDGGRGREDSPLRAITKEQAHQLVSGLVNILLRMEIEPDA